MKAERRRRKTIQESKAKIHLKNEIENCDSPRNAQNYFSGIRCQRNTSFLSHHMPSYPVMFLTMSSCIYSPVRMKAL